jgi:hypothetical protein
MRQKSFKGISGIIDILSSNFFIEAVRFSAVSGQVTLPPQGVRGNGWFETPNACHL